MAMFKDDSTDDVTCCYLQLEERLRINRGERPSDSRNAMSGKDLKQFCNQQRKKNGYDEHSSSSSSLDTYNDPSIPGPSSGYNSQNKKRQNGDKPIDQFVNPKRTCLDDAFHRSPVRSDCRRVNQNGDIPHSKKVMDFTTNPPRLSNRSLLPGNTYEDHINDLSDFSDFESWPSAADKKKKKPLVNTLPKLPGLFEVPPIGSQGVQFVDSTSEDDSRTTQMGSLKGGRQSPDQTNNKMVLRRKIKRVLESDDSDSDEWNVGYRARPITFSSSDSDDSQPDRRSKDRCTAASKKSANLSFSPKDSQASGQGRSCGRGRPSRSLFNADAPSARSNFHRTRGSNRMNGTFRTLAEGLEMVERQRMQQGMSRRRALRNSRDPDAIPPYNRERGCLSDFDSIGNGDVPSSPRLPSAFDPSLPHPSLERNSRMSSQPRNSRNPPDASRSSRRRPVGRARPPNERPSLPALHPNIFDAEDSSEVEFFTANSYSDNESNTEPLARVNIFRPASEPEVRSNLSINVGSSEDEISVVYTSGPQTRSPHSRTSESRRRPRTLGRRSNRGSRRSSLPQTPGVSLSPDPVEQVRQVEEDERFARVLQAQFDAEVDPTYIPRPHSSPNPCLMNIREATSSDEDTSSVDVEEMFSANPDMTEMPYTSTIHLNQLLSPIYFPDRRSRVPQRIDLRLNWAAPLNGSSNSRGRTRAIEHWHPQHPWLQNMAFSEDNSYEAFLGLVEMNGDVTRGLQRSQINRLPTRKYTTFSSASSSSELPHKRAELNKECQVCLNDYVEGDVLRILPCFHEFHTPCIDPWLKINHTCPVCRVVVDLDD